MSSNHRDRWYRSSLPPVDFKRRQQRPSQEAWLREREVHVEETPRPARCKAGPVRKSELSQQSSIRELFEKESSSGHKTAPLLQEKPTISEAHSGTSRTKPMPTDRFGPSWCETSPDLYHKVATWARRVTQQGGVRMVGAAHHARGARARLHEVQFAGQIVAEGEISCKTRGESQPQLTMRSQRISFCRIMDHDSASASGPARHMSHI